MPQYTAMRSPYLVDGPVLRPEEPVAPRGDLIARLEGLTSNRAVRDPSNQRGHRILSRELAAQHIRDVTPPAGSNHDRPSLSAASKPGRTRRVRRSQARTSMG